MRAFRPAAAHVTVAAGGKRSALVQVHPGGVFEGRIDGAKLPLDYRLEVDYGDSGVVTIDDPYRFLPTIGELDVHLLGEGRHPRGALLNYPQLFHMSTFIHSRRKGTI